MKEHAQTHEPYPCKKHARSRYANPIYFRRNFHAFNFARSDSITNHLPTDITQD